MPFDRFDPFKPPIEHRSRAVAVVPVSWSEEIVADRTDQAGPLHRGSHEARLRFHGTGHAYARLWFTHALLTLLTLGVYSAWAAVRKRRWFLQHTELLDSRFDYHGEAWRILIGRALALVLLVGYLHAFDINLGTGLVIYAALALAAPLLFLSAQRFKARQTSWRGLRFDYRGGTAETCWRVLPVVALVMSGTVLTAMQLSTWAFALATAGAALAWPAAHAMLKRMQHRQASYGDQPFRARSLVAAFYRAYAQALGLLLLAGVLASMAGAMVVWLAQQLQEAWQAVALPGWERLGGWTTGWLAGLLSAAIAWAIVQPHLAARLQQAVWLRTSLAGVRFRSEMTASGLRAVMVREYGRVLLSLGLYSPWAAVAVARYRIESLVLVSDTPLTLLAEQGQLPAVGTLGDGAAQAFDLDLGW
jgi:uncharacterized membrane protein YjgN (DUF898 family)